MTGRKVTAEERAAYDLVTKRDDNRCVKCRRWCGRIERDHRQNRMPGNTVASNLQCLGEACHEWKTQHPTEALEQGWAVLRHTTLSPAEWPARRWLRTFWGTYRLAWVLYDDEGGWVEIDDVEAAFRRRKGGLP
ncbi:MAG: hypothetical protein LCH43_11410 [Actinobacteria bacterium]|nr:hypothetical protein [Actinomycetota bacterium]